MRTPLTRDVVEDFEQLALREETLVDTDGGHHNVYEALAKMIDHDEAQRQLIEQQAATIRELEEEIARLIPLE